MMRRALETILIAAALVILALVLPKGWSEIFRGYGELEE